MLHLRRSNWRRTPRMWSHRVLVAAVIVGSLLTAAAGPASALPRQWAGGSVDCSFAGTLRFSPPLTMSGGGTHRSKLRATLSGCTTQEINLTTVPGGKFVGSFSHSPFNCATLSTTSAPLTGTVRWEDGYESGPTAFKGTDVNSNIASSSFAGTTRLTLDTPAQLASGCVRGLTQIAITGTFVAGPSCGPGFGPVSIYPIDTGPMCGDRNGPITITPGPDGALWFQNSLGSRIGRITTSGVVSLYTSLDSQKAVTGLTAGPDGGMWFTDYYTHTVGRMTTDGVVTNLYTDPSIAPTDITAGPDGALWFTSGGNGNPFSGAGSAIGTITTSGVITDYTDPGILNPTSITVGPDGALWFINFGYWQGAGINPVKVGQSIGRITTSGVVTIFADPQINGPTSLVAGSDGAMWFLNDNSIGRVSTSGTFTYYTDPAVSAAFDMTPGPDGALWFTNYTGDPGTIGRITTAGVVTTPIADQSIEIPYAITTGSDGALWFVNKESDTIGRIAPPG